MEKQLQIEVITVAFMYPTLLGTIPYVGPAFDTALTDIHRQYPLLNITQKFVFDRTGVAGQKYVEWLTIYEDMLGSFYFKSCRNGEPEFDVTVFIMSGSGDVIGVAGFATELDKLMISSVGQVDSFRNKKKWPTWITTSTNSVYTFRKVYETLTDMYNWTDLAIVIQDNSNPIFPDVASYVHTDLSARPANQVNSFHLYSDRIVEGQLSMLMQNISRISRVIFYFGYAQTLHDLMIAAASLKMTLGEYVFVAFLPFRHWSFGSFAWAKEDAFRTLLIMESLPPSEQNAQLNQEWKNMSRVKYNYTYGSKEVVSPHPASTYAAMLSMAEVMEELRINDPNNTLESGQKIARHFMNRTFGLMTGNLTIDWAGERIPTMVLTQVTIDTDNVSVVMLQDAESGQLRKVKSIAWPISWPIPDQPSCGFRGDSVKCQTSGNISHATQLGAAFGTVLVVIVVILVTVVSGRMRNTEESLWWRMDRDGFGPVADLKFENYRFSASARARIRAGVNSAVSRTG